MSRKFLVSIDLAKNELQNAVVQNLASAPSSPSVGQIYYDTGTNQAYVYNGTSWVSMAGGSVSFGNVTAQTSFGAASGNGVASTASRSDHTHGTPTHDNAAHAGINLSALAAPTGNVSFGNYKITSLADPTSAQDAATKSYVDTIAEGLHVHASCVAATTANLTATYDNGTSGVGATLTNSGTQAALVIDGVTLSVSDRVLVKNQSTQLQNGIYVVTTVGSGSTNWVLTRASDFDTSAEINGGDFVFVTGGTQGDNTGWVQTSTGVTIGTTAIVFQQFSGAGTYTAGNGITITGTEIAVDPVVVARKYAQTLSTSATSYTITHGLGTLDVMVTVYTVSDGSEVVVDNLRATTNTVTLNFNVAPSANAYRVVVIG